jgi:hypothetical protein
MFGRVDVILFKLNLWLLNYCVMMEGVRKKEPLKYWRELMRTDCWYSNLLTLYATAMEHRIRAMRVGTLFSR